MSNPDGPGDEPDTLSAEQYAADFETEVLSAPDAADPTATADIESGERRFTAPSGMDAGSTQVMHRNPDPATEIIDMAAAGVVADDGQTRMAVPQEIPPRSTGRQLKIRSGRWGWALAVLLVIAALAAVAALGALLLSRATTPKVSQEDLVRTTIRSFDGAIQKGDLATLRGLTCGATADSYNTYDDREWGDTHARVVAAQQYPVVASIDDVVVNGDHAEANVTSFMAFDPATRSTRSFDLEFRDEQWKICQAPGS